MSNRSLLAQSTAQFRPIHYDGWSFGQFLALGSYLVLLFVLRWQQKLANEGFMLNLERLIPLWFAILCLQPCHERKAA